MTLSSPSPVPPGTATSEQRSERANRTAGLLSCAAHCDDPELRQQLLHQVVELNMRVAEAIASRYRNRGIGDDDLTQVAYLALTKAARRFDADAGHDFLSFAVPTIRGEVRRHFRDSGWMVRPPRKLQELQSRIFGAQSDLAAATGRSPSPSELARHLGAELADVEEALAAEGCFRPTSLDRTIGRDGDVTIGELLSEEDGSQSAVDARVVLKPAVRRLSERDRRVVRLRFFDDCTQQEIAEQIGVTQTQVSRLLSRILRELRDDLDGTRIAS